MEKCTFETGGEVLGEGDTVIVIGGPQEKECRIEAVGARSISMLLDGRLVAFRKSDRRSTRAQGGRGRYFETKTERAVRRRRWKLTSQLRKRGIRVEEAPGPSPARYSNQALAEVIAILDRYANSWP